MQVRFELEFDDKKIREALGEFRKDAGKIKKRMLSKILSVAKRNVKKGLRGRILKKDTGELYKSVAYKVYKGGAGTIRAGAFYASFHEQGAEIKPRKPDRYLVFKIGDEWKKAKTVILPKREFFNPVVRATISSYETEEEMDKLMQLILDQYFKRKYGLQSV